MTDAEWLNHCLENRYCIVPTCGKSWAHIHHRDAIGSGRNRRKYDDSKHKKAPLCFGHHAEIEQIGRRTFAKKYGIQEFILVAWDREKAYLQSLQRIGGK